MQLPFYVDMLRNSQSFILFYGKCICKISNKTTEHIFTKLQHKLWGVFYRYDTEINKKHV